MKRSTLPAIAAALLAAPAFGAAIIVYDRELSQEFAIEREIVEIAQEVYGESAVYTTGDELPENLDAALTPRNPLPETPVVEPVPEELAGRLPHSEEGTEWMKVGDHLVEVNADGIIVMTVYDVLP